MKSASIYESRYKMGSQEWFWHGMLDALGYADIGREDVGAAVAEGHTVGFDHEGRTKVHWWDEPVELFYAKEYS